MCSTKSDYSREYLMVSNVQMSLNEFNKSKGMLMRNLFGKEKKINKCIGRKKGLEKRRRSNTKTNKKNNIKNDIIYNLVHYNK
jgi:hypothetical protein